MSEVAPMLLPDVLDLPLRDARDVFEAHYLRAVLGRFGGNITRAAVFIGMERTALHRKMRQLGVAASMAVPEPQTGIREITT